MEIAVIGAIVVIFTVWAIFPSLKAAKPKQHHKSAKSAGIAYIQPDHSLKYHGKYISLADARKKGVTIEFEPERQKRDEYRPKAWR